MVAGLILLRQRIPELSNQVTTLIDGMNWGAFYDSANGLPFGCLPGSVTDPLWNNWNYNWLAADSRLAHFIGIGTGDLPPGSWDNLNDAIEPNSSDLSSEVQHYEPGWNDANGIPGVFKTTPMPQNDNMGLPP